ncbi:MAG: formate--tetrahydrofolate ligase [Chloroflexi bacterium]|nr:formate--tetrahydrofolate ligase [Chloroflexota bacterium]
MPKPPLRAPRNATFARLPKLNPIAEIARPYGLDADDLDFYGKYKAKVHLDVLKKLADRPQGKYIVVTAITPTPLGEGKTVTTVGLSQALKHIGKKVATCIRQPSMGPTFGIKGGAAGGGYSQVVPMEEFNLHLTGDIHAVSIAHNLLAAAIDAHMFHGNALDIDQHALTWQRVLDLNDRALRSVIVGLGGKANGKPRETGYDIAVASEVMAVLALATDLQDLRRRLGRIVIGTNSKGKAVTAEDLKAAGAMTVLLKDALMPNILQTLEHNIAFVHCGPFANIAHGNNSIVADQIALRAADYVVTESGFGADMGMEKFMDIKCRYSGLKPSAVVVVATLRALKMHGGAGRVVAGRALPKEIAEENMPALEKGAANLRKQIQNATLFGLPCVVAVNHFAGDSEKEIAYIEQVAREAGAEGAFLSDVHSQGGAGGADLARAVVAACEKPSDFNFLYPLDRPIKEKIETIASKVYGAARVEYLPDAEKKIKLYTDLGYANLPICMAKTHLSLSHDPNLKGAPSGFTLPIRDIRVSVGAGFLYPLCGEMLTMPGLPSEPAFQKVDIDENGKIVGLF